MNGPLLEIRALEVRYPRAGKGWRSDWLPAVRRLDLDLQPGECLGLVGESGCGKSSLARAIAGLIEPPARVSGHLKYRGRELGVLRPVERARRVQYVFQHPYSAFDPRRRIGDSVADPLGRQRPDLDSGQLRRRVADWLEQVELDPALARRYPGELSGGQCQRAAIARALIVEPELLICDEAVSGLDVAARVRILELLGRLQARRNLGLLFIAHDLASVRRLCQRVLVMYAGRIVEDAATEALFQRPAHPYTRALLAARPGLDGRLPPAPGGEPPIPGKLPGGCSFRPRCGFAEADCEAGEPPLSGFGAGRVACLHARSVGDSPPEENDD